MTYRNRERVTRAFAHREPDRVPFCTGGPPKSFVEIIDSLNPDADRRTCYTEGDFEYIAFHPLVEREIYLPYLPGLPEDAEITDWGVGEVVLHSEEGYGAGRKRWYPLAQVNTISELEDYPWPDFTDPRRHADLEERIRAARDEGYTVIGQMSQTILENSYCMRGMEQLFLDMYERPDYVDALFEKVAERRRFQARRFMEAGADILRIGDDIATQESLIIGPELYRQRIKPFHASVINTARKLRPDVPVLYHSDGKLTELLPELIDVGVTGIHPVQVECMDLAAVKREFGKDLVLWGCLPTQSVFAFGTAEQVRKHLHFLMDQVARDGGLIVEFYNILPTPKLMDNVRVFYEEFYDLARH